MCIITYRDNVHWTKLANNGAPGIWVGYADGHPTAKCQIFNPKTKKIILTGDMNFLHKPYGEYKNVEKSVLVTMSYDRSDDEKDLKWFH